MKTQLFFKVDNSVGAKWRLVSANDLFAYRMLEDPVKITVRSFDRREYMVIRDTVPIFSSEINVVFEDGDSILLTPDKDNGIHTTYYSNFFGMGMGFHPSGSFSGPLLHTLLEGFVKPYDAEWNRKGLVCFAAVDGYRAIYSYSELFNRADQIFPILAIPDDPADGGYFRIFSPAEFYADRSVKSLKELYLFTCQPSASQSDEVT